MVLHLPLHRGPLTALEMTSEAVYSELEGAVQGCSTWHVPTAVQGHGARRRSFDEMNKPTMHIVLKLAVVRSGMCVFAMNSELFSDACLSVAECKGNNFVFCANLHSFCNR